MNSLANADALANSIWVDTNQKLQEMCADLSDCTDKTLSGSVALDTEFQRVDTFYPIPGLYQLASDNQIYLVDPQPITQWSPFVDFLADESIEKIIHAGSEDLELFMHHLNVRPLGLFDTQVAHGLISDRYASSYASLVELITGDELDKKQTRSNWLKRPLTENQLHYAALDVAYLKRIRDWCRERLEENQRSVWFAEEMQVKGAHQSTTPDQYYKGVKKGWRLSGSQLWVLRALCEWRELTAQAEDVPRNRVIMDEHLFGFCQKQPLELHHVEAELPPRIAKKYADKLIQVHRQSTAEQQTLETLPMPLSPAQNKVVNQLRDAARVVSERLGVAPELLARKRDVEACVRQFIAASELSEVYLGWRGDLLGEQFLAILNSQSREVFTVQT